MDKKLMSMDKMFNLCERSVHNDTFIQNMTFIGDKYINSELKERYTLPGYEHLCKLVQNIIESGRGYYIVNYVHEKGINVYTTGITDLNLLIDYSNWYLKHGKEALLLIQDEIIELLEEENQMSLEEIRLKNIEYLETQRKILENIFDMEKKVPYCKKLETIKTVQQSLNNFVELMLLMDPLEIELKNLGFIK